MNYNGIINSLTDTKSYNVHMCAIGLSPNALPGSVEFSWNEVKSKLQEIFILLLYRHHLCRPAELQLKSFGMVLYLFLKHASMVKVTLNLLEAFFTQLHHVFHQHVKILRWHFLVLLGTKGEGRPLHIISCASIHVHGTVWMPHADRSSTNSECQTIASFLHH